VLRGEPDWQVLRPATPESIRKLLRRCVEKDRKRRLADIADARIEIEDALTTPANEGALPLPARTTWRWPTAIAGLIAVLAIAGLTAATVWYARSPAPPRITRTLLTVPGAASLFISENARDVAITPDGTRVVYVGGDNGTELFVRSLDAIEPVAIASGLPRGVFLSPDGRWAGYFDDGGATLRKVALTGGPPLTLTRLGVRGGRGATWAPDDTIIFSTTAGSGLQRISAADGEPTSLTRPNRERGENDHWWPEMLPGGRALVFAIRVQTGSTDAGNIAVLDLKTGTQKVVVQGGSDPHYVASGHLVYSVAGGLRAVPFDIGRLQATGTPVPVAPRLATKSEGAADFAVASDGSLVYVSGRQRVAQRTLVFFDRSGREQPIPAPAREYVAPRISPDGTRAALDIRGQDDGLWIWDFRRSTLTRLAVESPAVVGPVWTPDGRRLIFGANVDGVRNVFSQAADGTGISERLLESARAQLPTSVSPDGARLVFVEDTPTMQRDLMLLTFGAARRVEPLLQSPADEINAVVSPDGRWLAYESNASGRFEVYVRPFPNIADGQWRLSTGGGGRPVWTRGGQELVYVGPDKALIAVRVEGRGSAWQASALTKLLDAHLGYYTGSVISRTFDVSADGQRFLMIKPVRSDEPTLPPTVVLVQNWGEELKRLAPAK
jgi:hypothetical protein